MSGLPYENPHDYIGANQDNEDNPWIGKTVDAVIEDYKSDKELAPSIYELISSTDIIAEITI